MLSKPSEKMPHAGVKVKPPLLYGSAVLLGGLLQGVFPWPLIQQTEQVGWITGLQIVGGLLVLSGIGLMGWAINSFKAAKTPLPPWVPVTALVTSGPFAFSRNPIYSAFTLCVTGIACALNSLWILLLLLPVWALMRYYVIAREEAYLSQLFGQAYHDYQRRVRRWL